MENKMKKILLIHPDVRDYRVNLFDRLSSKFNIKFLFTGRNNRSKDFKESDNWDISYEPYQNFIGYDKTFSLGALKHIFSKKYDTIIASGLASFTTHISLLAKIFQRKKLILWDETWDWPRTLFAKLAKPYVKLIVKKSDACIAAGTKAKELYIKFGADPKKVFIAPNSAIDLSDKRMTQREIYSKKEELGLKDKKIILYLSRIVKYKGLDYLIKAFRDIETDDKDAFLLIGGDGPFKKDCEKLSKTLKIDNIRFLGMVPHEKVSEYFNICDVFVLPSRKLDDKHECSEAWGLVINEVMSIGKPVISTTAVAAAYDLIKEGKNGYMVEERDENNLTESILKIIKDKELIEKMSEESRKIIRSFSEEEQFRGFVRGIKHV